MLSDNPVPKYELLRQFLITMRMIGGFQVTSCIYSQEQLEDPKVQATIIKATQEIVTCSEEEAKELFTFVMEDMSSSFFHQHIMDTVFVNERNPHISASLGHNLADVLQELHDFRPVQERLNKVVESVTGRPISRQDTVKNNNAIILSKLDELERLEKLEAKIKQANTGWRATLLKLIKFPCS